MTARASVACAAGVLIAAHVAGCATVPQNRRGHLADPDDEPQRGAARRGPAPEDVRHARGGCRRRRRQRGRRLRLPVKASERSGRRSLTGIVSKLTIRRAGIVEPRDDPSCAGIVSKLTISVLLVLALAQTGRADGPAAPGTAASRRGHPGLRDADLSRRLRHDAPDVIQPVRQRLPGAGGAARPRPRETSARRSSSRRSRSTRPRGRG